MYWKCWRVKLANITSTKNENKHTCCSCTLYMVLLSITFTIYVRIGTYFVYHKCMNCNKETAVKESFNYQTTFDY